jgi:hypothetical protein
MYAPNASFEDPLTHAQGYVNLPTKYSFFLLLQRSFTHFEISIFDPWLFQSEADQISILFTP